MHKIETEAKHLCVHWFDDKSESSSSSSSNSPCPKPIIKKPFISMFTRIFKPPPFIKTAAIIVISIVIIKHL